MPRSMGGKDDEAGSSRSKHSRQYETVEEVLLPQVHHEFLLWEGCNKEAKSRMECDEEINEMLRIKLQEAGSNEKYSLMWRGLEILTSLKQFIKSFAMSFIQPMNLMKLRLYHADELFEEGFDVYLQGVCYPKHQNGYANVAWLIARWMKRKGVGTQKESQICCGQFIPKLARKVRVLSDEPGVPRVAIPRPLRASMRDLYERMGSMKIRQGAIERMAYRQPYHWDRYAGVFEHIAGVYSVSLQGAYNPPGYAQP
ncbi:hypothetical protein Tco_0325070 [Tanacetum coccineum]